MELGIALKVDPNGALPAIKRVEDGLSAAERKAKETSRAMTSGMNQAAGAFSSVVAAIARQQEALGRLSEHMRKLPLDQAAAAFGKLAEAIDREQQALKRLDAIQDPFRRNIEAISRALGEEADMLERIHGPAREYARDVMTLDRLLQQGRISAEAHALELHKLGAGYEHAARGAQQMTHAQAQLATKTIGLPGVPTKQSALSGANMGTAVAAGGLVGGVIAGGSAAVNVVEDAREKNRTLKDEFIAMSNQARKFALEEGRQVNEVLDEQLVISRDLRQSVGSTMAFYDDLGDATGELNLTHREQIRLMERLGKAAANEGQDLGRAGEFMKRLGQNMTLGKDAGKQLEGMMRELPAVSKIWVDKYGGDSKAFIAAVDAGKESYASLVDQIIAGSSDIESAFAANQRSHAQWKTAVREEEIRIRFEGGGDRDTQVSNRIARGRVGGSTGALFDNRKITNVAPGLFGNAFDVAARAGRQASAAETKSNAETVTKVLGVLSGTVQDLGTHADVTAGNIDQRFNRALDEGADIAAKATKEITSYERLLEEINGPTRRAINDNYELFTMWEKGAITLEQLNRATEQRRNLLLELGVIEAKSVTGGKLQTSAIDLSGASTKPTEGRGTSTSWLQGHMAGYVADAQKHQMKMAADAKKAAREMQEAWASAAGSVIGDFARMAMEGEMSFGDMLDQSLKKAALLALQLGAASIGGGPAGSFVGSLFGALGGGANGFDYMANGRRVQLPGFATGGDAMVTGHGGTDSKLAMFRITPGESLHVRTPQQRMAEAEEARRSGAGRTGKQVTNVIVQSDPREVTSAMSGREGARAMVRLNRSWRR